MLLLLKLMSYTSKSVDILKIKTNKPLDLDKRFYSQKFSKNLI